MKNILYLHAGAEMYGADKILLELVSGLNQSKFHPIVILPEHGILEEKLKKNNIETYVITYPILRRKYMNPSGIVYYLVNYRKKCNDIINFIKSKNLHIDIIHVNTMAVLEGIYLKKRLKTKLLWHVHEIIMSPKLVAKFLSYCVGKYSDIIVTVSEAVRENLIASKMVSSNKIRTIYNGIDSKVFNPNVKYDYLFKEWDIPKNSIRVGMIGRINSWKGQNDFLEATAPLLSQYSNLYIFIIGSAFKGQEWRVKKLKEKISQLNNHKRIIFSEFRKDNYAVENFFDILVLPSTNPDPLPTVVLEAMGCGKAIVGYSHGGVREMVKNNWNGLLAAPGSISSLQEKINDCLLENKYIEMGKKSRKRQEKIFSIDSFISSFESVYAVLNEG